MKWHVPQPQKLVAFLQGQLGDYSGKFLRRLLEANLCRINGKVERFGSRVVQGGDAVELAPTWKSLLNQKALQFETLYEDESLKIVGKPAGWVCTDEQAVKTFGPKHYLVHRLDKDTTGLLMLAKSTTVRDQLMGLFEKREIQKSYLALVDGVPQEKEGVRKSLFVKKGSFQGQTIWGSGSEGLTAITHWSRLAASKNASLVLCQPETGRTHQIRVHMAEMGHPILVDRQYAKSFRCPFFFQRPLLHAHRLQFSFQGKEIDVTAPLPVDMRDALRTMCIEPVAKLQFRPKSALLPPDSVPAQTAYGHLNMPVCAEREPPGAPEDRFDLRGGAPKSSNLSKKASFATDSSINR